MIRTTENCCKRLGIANLNARPGDPDDDKYRSSHVHATYSATSLCCYIVLKSCATVFLIGCIGHTAPTSVITRITQRRSSSARGVHHRRAETQTKGAICLICRQAPVLPGMADAVATADVDRIFSLTPFGICLISLPEHLSNTHRPPPMSLMQPGISAVILNTFLDLLIPLFLTAACGDPGHGARSCAGTVRPLQPTQPAVSYLATQVIGNGMTSLTMLGKTTEGGLSLDDINGAKPRPASPAPATRRSAASKTCKPPAASPQVGSSQKKKARQRRPQQRSPTFALSTPAPCPGHTATNHAGTSR